MSTWPPLTHQDVQDRVDSALQLASVISDYVATSETTTSTTFTDLATVGPAATVTIGSSGRALVMLGAFLVGSAVGTEPIMGFAVSGATTRAASHPEALRFQAYGAGIEAQYTAVVLVTGLSPGSTTFTAKYVAGVTGTATFIYRRIAVMPV